MKNSAQVFTPESLPVISYKCFPVVTTSQLAALYGTSTTNITSNTNRNKERFVEGKHQFTLTASELKAFKNEVTKSDFVTIAKTVNHLTLWTERGAARHAKMLDTDQAWDVFEKLEECYFNHKPSMPVPARVNPQSAKSVPSKVSVPGRVHPRDIKNIDPVFVELMSRCSDKDLVCVYTLFGMLETGKPFVQELRFV